MNNDTNNHVLANKLEPFDTLPKLQDEIVPVWESMPSPRGAWHACCVYADGDTPHWYPADFYNHDGSNCVIIDALLAKGCHTQFIQQKTGGVLLWIHYEGEQWHSEVADRRSAVCEAGMRFL